MMAEAFVAVGSNIDPAENIAAALARLTEVARVRAVSTFYAVRPLDRPQQPDFRNGVFQIATNQDPSVLHNDVLRGIEEEIGRERSRDKHAARTIDLDLVMYEDIEFQDGDLIIPDPDILERNFVAVAELAPQTELPGVGRTLDAIATELGTTGLTTDETLTRTLREILANEHGTR